MPRAKLHLKRHAPSSKHAPREQLEADSPNRITFELRDGSKSSLAYTRVKRIADDLCFFAIVPVRVPRNAIERGHFSVAGYGSPSNGQAFACPCQWRGRPCSGNVASWETIGGCHKPLSSADAVRIYCSARDHGSGSDILPSQLPAPLYAAIEADLLDVPPALAEVGGRSLFSSS